jgi:stage IV sporulation protein FB
MRWSLNIGTIAGTAVRVHITFLLFLIWIFAANYASGGADAAWSGLLFMILLFACVVAHEFGHIFTARAFGVSTPDVTLLPIGGVARLERIPEEPRQEFLIAIAGPAVNVVIGFALILLAGAHLDPADLAVDSARISMIDRLANVNLFLAVFNMIPAFPMDGGRVLRALLATRMGFTHATEVAASVGQATAFVLGFAGLLMGNPILIFIAIFVYLAATSEAHVVAMRAMSHGVPVTNAMMTQFAKLMPQAHVDEAVQTLLRTSQSEFPVVDAADKPVGLLGRADLIRALKQFGPDARVADVMTATVPTVDYRRCLEDALRLLQAKAAPAVAVVDGQGRLVGLVTSETIGEMMMLREALPKGTTWGPWSRPSGA